MWTADPNRGQILRIDPGTRRVVARIPINAEARAAAGAGAVWALACGAQGHDARHRDRRRRRVGAHGRRPAAPARGAQRPVRDRDARAHAGSRHLFPGPPGTLALIGDDQIALVDVPSGRRLWRTTLAGEIRCSLADDDALWADVSRAPVEPEHLVRLDADSGRPRGQVAMPEPGVAGMAKVGRDIWVATPGGRIVVVR
jgi:hypothetical protein